MPKILTRKEWSQKLSCIPYAYGDIHNDTYEKAIARIMWVPITEALPEEGSRVLAIPDKKEDQEHKYYVSNFEDGVFWVSPGFTHHRGLVVTHWTYQILPEDAE